MPSEITLTSATSLSITLNPTPEIGSSVHFVNGNHHVPAVITAPAYPFGDGTGQALTVFPVGEPPFTTVASQDAAAAPATWHWPE